MAKTRWARDYTRDIIDAKERFDDVREHIKEPPDGQVPVGDWGIYTSPNLQNNQPVSPFNCNQYSDSPYCGGTPWTKTPVGFEPEWGFNECGAWVQLTPVLLFTKLPPVSVGWRRPGKCREEEKPIQPPKPVEDLPDEWKDIRPDSLPGGFRPDDIVLAATTTTIYRLEARFIAGKRLTNSAYYQGYLDSIISPTTATAASPPGGKYFSPTTALASGGVHWSYFSSRQLFNVVYNANEPDINQVDYRNFAIHPNYPKQGENGGWYEGNTGALGGKGDYIGIGWSIAGEGVIAAIYYGRFGSIFPSQSLPFSVGISPDGINASLFKINLAYLKKISGSPDHYPPPPDQKKKKKCCMQCCSGGNQQSNKQDQDLSEIKKMLKEIKKRLGTDEYPVPMPESLNVKYDDKGKRSDPKMIKEENLTGVLGRFIRYFDGVVGEFGLGFKVADADPTKPGDQPKFITANNISELLEEMYSHIFDMWIMQYQFLQLDQRHAIESMSTRKVAIQNYYLLLSLVDWAGFKTKDIKKKIQFLFDLDAEGFEGFLKNKEEELQVPDFDPDDEGADSFPDHLFQIKRAAAIIEAVHTTKFRDSSDIPKQIMEMLLNTGKNIDRVNSDELKSPGSKEDFDQWLRDAETAFINRIGTGDVTNPYGVPYAQRPRLTKIADTESTEEES
jgi:hypothetical protein